ncbi:hypothetical protein PLESTB_000282500 [Pleodorina starrii]|uniref:Uncharacterized protein n=1 Tax=Pleodorina starrii TaxID=330485 RepID=A0A9W6BDV9_9CHLO|nr:hypothetical protein PLESTM_001407000 [Pleodorina starrii]GLC49746.1 hypothetical protein PLESTB_000282500 [Pleodorina starrii]
MAVGGVPSGHTRHGCPTPAPGEILSYLAGRAVQTTAEAKLPAAVLVRAAEYCEAAMRVAKMGVLGSGFRQHYCSGAP